MPVERDPFLSGTENLIPTSDTERIRAAKRPQGSTAMKQAIVYGRREEPGKTQAAERQLVKEGYAVRRRNERDFAGICDPCDLVVASSENIRQAYARAGKTIEGFARFIEGDTTEARDMSGFSAEPDATQGAKDAAREAGISLTKLPQYAKGEKIDKAAVDAYVAEGEQDHGITIGPA